MSFSLDHPLEKEKQDYVYCLNSSLSLHSTDYAFLLEDDAYPLDDFFPVLLDTLNHFSSSLDHTHDASPAYVKFFHPERLSTFADVVSIIELISWVLLSGTVLHVTYCCFRPLPLSTHSSWLLCLFYALLFALAINRPGLMELRRLTPSLYALLPAPSCCTPAMLFPKSSANAIVSFLQSKTCENNLGKDSILDEFLEFSNLNAYVVQPNVVMHIGMYSALRQNIVDPFLM
ncbi:hypothetical protein CAPTEDRAFT_119972 [Capitella teleta]|uniref:Uncharacterized protein n=1 Tax=Capitella teleta TaxID=283909 RepID=R7UPW7_CAPTE|nr:hypothetical protein CAPTEDRAFT_119972 [Capitella teleta]|eukprot:ELU05471.1 hypothetical protein CAPTEDRAFT_119972 [Capitella teleta]